LRTAVGTIGGGALGVCIAAATVAPHPALVVVGFATVGAYAALLVRPYIFGRVWARDVRIVQLLAAVNITLLLVAFLGTVLGVLSVGALLILRVARKWFARHRTR